jgi:prevent-host-death family protein
MAKINVHDAKTHFSRLLHRVESGEEIVIAKAGKPVARIVPLSEIVAKRMPGSAKGRIHFKKDFFKPLPKSLLKDFEK